MPTLYELKYLASIPVGNAALVLHTQYKEAFFDGWTDADPILIDLVTGIVYGPEWTPPEVRSAKSDLQALSGGSYRLHPYRDPQQVKVVSCLVRSRGWGEQNELSTFLGVEPLPPDTAYR